MERFAFHRDIDTQIGIDPKTYLPAVINRIKLPNRDSAVQVTNTKRQVVFARGVNGHPPHVCVVESPNMAYVRYKKPHGAPPKGVSDKCEYQIFFPHDDRNAREAAIEEAFAKLGATPDKLTMSPAFLKERVSITFPINYPSLPIKIMVAGDRCRILADPQENGDHLGRNPIMQMIEVKLTGVPVDYNLPPYGILMETSKQIITYLTPDVINPNIMTKAKWVDTHTKRKG